jgi:hypothetical protein
MGDAITSAVVTSAIARVPVNATGGIPSDKLNEILLNEEHMTKLQPLIAKAVKQASLKQVLRDAITKLFKDEATKDSALSEALTALQNALQLIYEKTKGANQENPNEANEENPNEAMDKITKTNAYFYNNAGGGGRRRTNKRRKSKKRNYYKKRRTSKYR